MVLRGPPVPAVAVLRIAGAETVPDVAGVDAEPVSDEAIRGDLGRAVPLPLIPGFRNGDAVRLITGGVCVRDGGLLGRLMAGLSHDEKKSSAGSPTGVAVPSLDVENVESSTTTSSGNLIRT